MSQDERNEDVLMVTLDALRFDVASAAMSLGKTPFLASLLPAGWERRHTPGSFTLAAHAAFFAGFWPTPAQPGPHSRPFALRFAGASSLGPQTRRLEGENIVAGLRQVGYRTVCIGGVGFFNKLNPLGSIFPGYFEVSHWQPEFAVTESHSTREQVRAARELLIEDPRPLFLFLNISALHSPTHMYLRGARSDSVQTQIEALRYVDSQLPPLFAALQQRGRAGRGFLMSDHGTLFGEEGFHGHRVGHPDVWTVPYGECRWGDAA